MLIEAHPRDKPQPQPTDWRVQWLARLPCLCFKISVFSASQPYTFQVIFFHPITLYMTPGAMITTFTLSMYHTVQECMGRNRKLLCRRSKGSGCWHIELNFQDTLQASTQMIALCPTDIVESNSNNMYGILTNLIKLIC